MRIAVAALLALLLAGCASMTPFSVRDQREAWIRQRIRDSGITLEPFMGRNRFLCEQGYDGVPEHIPPSAAVRLDLLPGVPGKEIAVLLNGCGSYFVSIDPFSGHLFVFSSLAESFSDGLVFHDPQQVFMQLAPVRAAGKTFLVTVYAVIGWTGSVTYELYVLGERDGRIEKVPLSAEITGVYYGTTLNDKAAAARLDDSGTCFELASSWSSLSSGYGIGEWTLNAPHDRSGGFTVSSMERSYVLSDSAEGDSLFQFCTKRGTFTFRYSEATGAFHIRSDVRCTTHF